MKQRRSPLSSARSTRVRAGAAVASAPTSGRAVAIDPILTRYHAPTDRRPPKRPQGAALVQSWTPRPLRGHLVVRLRRAARGPQAVLDGGQELVDFDRLEEIGGGNGRRREHPRTVRG